MTEVKVRNDTPGRRVLNTGTDLKAGEEKTLDGDDAEAAKHFVGKGDFEVVEGDLGVEQGSQSEETNESESEAKKGLEAGPVIEALPHLSDSQKADLKKVYDNLQELDEGLTQEELEGMENIGESYAEDIRETIENQ